MGEAKRYRLVSKPKIGFFIFLPPDEDDRMAQGGLKVKAKNKAAAKVKSSKANKVSKVNRNKVIKPKKVKAQEAAKVKKAIANKINSSIETELAAKAKQCEEGKEFKLVQPGSSNKKNKKKKK